MITWSILRKALYMHLLLLLLLLLLALFYRWAKYDSERLSNLAKVTQSFSLRQYGSRAHVLYSIIYSTTNSSSTCTQLSKAASWHISSKFTREESIHALASIFYQHFLSFPEWPPHAHHCSTATQTGNEADTIPVLNEHTSSRRRSR